MKFGGKIFCVFCFLFGWIIMSPCARGEFFWRSPKGGAGLLATLGGTRVYATEVTVNGRSGKLEVFSFSGLNARVIEKKVIESQDTKCRILTVSAAEGRHACTALVVTGDAALPNSSPPEWPASIPLFSATLRFSAVCKETGTSFLTAETTPSAPEAAVDALRENGFMETSPAGASCRIFVCGKKVCLVFASADPRGSGRVSVLLRAGAAPLF